MDVTVLPVRPASFEDLQALIGVEIGPTPWYDMTQERISAFADATGDHQWIHVDIERSAAALAQSAPVRGGNALSRQRSGFFSSEKRSGSRPIDGCSIGASTARAAGRSLMPGSLGTSRCDVAPRQRSSTALTKCISWPAAADGTVDEAASLRGS